MIVCAIRRSLTSPEIYGFAFYNTYPKENNTLVDESDNVNGDFDIDSEASDTDLLKFK